MASTAAQNGGCEHGTPVQTWCDDCDDLVYRAGQSICQKCFKDKRDCEHGKPMVEVSACDHGTPLGRDCGPCRYDIPDPQSSNGKSAVVEVSACEHGTPLGRDCGSCRYDPVESSSLLPPPLPEEETQLALWESVAGRLDLSRPDDLRAEGWTVAVHNDYRQDGEFYTFWLFTKGERAVKGEGSTDREALDIVRVRVSAIEAGQKAPPVAVDSV